MSEAVSSVVNRLRRQDLRRAPEAPTHAARAPSLDEVDLFELALSVGVNYTQLGMRCLRGGKSGAIITTSQRPRFLSH